MKLKCMGIKINCTGMKISYRWERNVIELATWTRGIKIK